VNQAAINGHVDVRKAVQDSCAVMDRDECFEYVYGAAREGTDKVHDCVRVRLHGWKKELGQQLECTGLTMWRAGEDLGRYLWENRAMLFKQGQGRQRILELGCGLGLCGLVAAQLNPKGVVVLTDGDALTMQKVCRNIDENSLKNRCCVAARTLQWGENKKIISEFKEGFDLVLAADVIYEEKAIGPLLSTVTATLRKGQDALFLLSYARRNVSIDRVLAAASSMGLTCEVDDKFSCSAEGEHVYRMRLQRKEEGIIQVAPSTAD